MITNLVFALLAILPINNETVYKNMIDFYALKNGLVYHAIPYVKAMAKVESNFNMNPNKHFPKDPSMGMMQIQPATGKFMCKAIIKTELDLLVAHKNIECGVLIFKEMLRRHKTVRLAIAAYNSGTPFYCKMNGIYTHKVGMQSNCRIGKLKNEDHVQKVMAIAKTPLYM